MKFGAKFSTCTIKCFEEFDERSFNIQSLSVELVPDCHPSEILFTFAKLSVVKYRGTTRHCSGRYDSHYFVTRKWWFVLFSDVEVLCRLFWICLSTVAWDPEYDGAIYVLIIINHSFKNLCTSSYHCPIFSGVKLLEVTKQLFYYFCKTISNTEIKA